MNLELPSRLAKPLAIFLLAGLAATWAVGAAKDRHEVAKMTEKMKTVCVGRLLFDIPEQMQMHVSRPAVDGFDIGTFNESDDEFQKRLARREAELRATPDRLGGNKNVELAREVKTASGLVGKIFLHGRTVEESSSSDGMTEEHYRDESANIEALVHGKGVSIDITTEIDGTTLVDDLSKLINQIVPNPDNRIPSESGFCIDRAYVRDPLTAEHRENLMMFAHLPSHPDIAIRLFYFTGLKPDAHGLLERMAQVRARRPEEARRFTQLRATRRTIGTLAGEELVQRVAEENGSVIYGFQWEVSGSEDNLYLPDLGLEMKTGNSSKGPVPSSLSEGAALGLWDKILSNIRLRPTAAPDTSAAGPAPVPLGAQARAGEACPHSGWWQCGAEGKDTRVAGGRRQYVEQGKRMPQALLLPPQTLWQKLRALQPSYETSTPTAWKLVDKRSRARTASPVPLTQAGAVMPLMRGQTASIGSLLQTGLPCPASGWWRCEDSDALDGTRWFAQGSLLPAATFAVSSRIDGRSAGTPMALQRRATWRLMRAAEAPEPRPGSVKDPGAAA